MNSEFHHFCLIAKFSSLKVARKGKNDSYNFTTKSWWLNAVSFKIFLANHPLLKWRRMIKNDNPSKRSIWAGIQMILSVDFFIIIIWKKWKWQKKHSIDLNLVQKNLLSRNCWKYKATLFLMRLLPLNSNNLVIIHKLKLQVTSSHEKLLLKKTLSMWK